MFCNAVDQHQINIFSGGSDLDFYMGKVCIMAFSLIEDIGFHLTFPAVAQFCCRGPFVMVEQFPAGFDADHIILSQSV